MIGKLLGALLDPKFGLYSLAQRYIKFYEGFSYDFDKNGESLLMDRLKQFNITTVFDVGANIGGWTEIAKANFPNADIHSFELSETTFLALQRNVNDRRITLNNVGLADAAGEIVYKDYGANSGVNTILQNAQFHDHWLAFSEKKGKLSTGDAYCTKSGIERINLLKVDVEGAEHLVLSGFSSMLKERRIDVIQFEYGYTHGDAHFLIKDFYSMFADWGYEIGPLKPSGVLFGDFRYRLNDFSSGPNFVAVVKNRKDIINAIRGSEIRGYM